MLLGDAQALLQRTLDPLGLDSFLDDVLGKRFVKLEGARNGGSRATLLGDDPQHTLLEAYRHLAPKLGCHAAAPSGPPPPIEPVPDAPSFQAKIAAFHERGYTVRLPEIRSLTSELAALIRALEMVFHQPVKVEAFWSRGDAKAPVHHDDYDIIVVHLRGRKRWFISTLTSDLPNDWKTLSDSPARIDRFTEVTVEPGDLLYLPRGTTHRVDAVSDSIHLSIGFVPLTVREAMIACLDHLSDLSRPLRDSAGARVGAQMQPSDLENIRERVRSGLASLVAHCQADGFIADALQRRSSRIIGNLDKLAAPALRTTLSPSTRLRHSRLSVSHLTGNATRIDFAYPGGHHLIHRGVEQSVDFIANTPEFCIRDIPGAVGDDVRIALVDKFVTCGFLEIAND
jgi:hypothetical protein